MDILKENFNSTLRKIAEGDFDEYKKFLEFAGSGNIVRYKFHNQTLIYDKKPETKVAAPYEYWKSVGRIPYKHSGIRIYDDEKFGFKCSHVFVLEDSVGDFYPGVWEATEHEREYIGHLMGNSMWGRDADIADCIKQLTHNYIGSKINLTNKKYINDNNTLIVENAINFIVLARCGTGYEFDSQAVEDYHAMSSDERVDFMRKAQPYIQDAAYRTIRYIDRHIMNLRKGAEHYERENVVMHGRSNTAYSHGVRNDDEQINGGGNGISRTGGNTDAYDKERDSGKNKDVRGNDSDIYRGELSTGISGVDAVRRDVSSRAEESGRGERDARRFGTVNLRKADIRSGESYTYGNDERKNAGKADSDGTDRAGYTVQTAGAGRSKSDTQGTGQLDFFSSEYIIDSSATAGTIEREIDRQIEEEAPVNTVESAAEFAGKKYTYLNPKPEEVPQEYIKQMLLRGSGFVNGKKRICDMYTGEVSPVKRAMLIKKEYGLGGAGWPIEGYGLHGFDTFKPDKGIRLQWRDEEGEKTGFISWNGVEKQIGALILTGEYDETEKSELKENAQAREKSRYEIAGTKEYALNTVFSGNSAYMSLHSQLCGICENEQLTDAEKIDAIRNIREHNAGYADSDYDMVEYDFKNGMTVKYRDIKGAYIEDKVDGSELLSAVKFCIKQEGFRTDTVLQSEIPEGGVKEVSDRKNYEQKEAVKFTFDNEWSADGGEKERFENNIKAIELLNLTEKENRPATEEEQKILSRYVGWGGLSSYFDSERHPDEYERLENILTESEFESARASTTDAFYTPKGVIEGVYAALDRMGFKGGNVLEPSCGTGNFIAGMPTKMRDKSRIFAVEKDVISGRIAKKLHPDCEVSVCGFEEKDYNDNFFDLVVGNVPFGDYGVHDKRYDKNNFKIHEYFIAKALDKVSAGGIVALITSMYTLDKKSCKTREYLAERAELLGAVRLPSDTFKGAANTEATSDILFFRKRDRKVIVTEESAPWVYTGVSGNEISVNSYYIDNPDMLLGKLVKDTSRFGPDRPVISLENSDKDVSVKDKIIKASGLLPKDAFAAVTADIKETEYTENAIPADPDVKNNTYTIVNGEVYYRTNSVMLPQKSRLSETAIQRVIGLCGIRNIFHEYMNHQLEGEPENIIIRDREELNRLYDEFIMKFGYIDSRANRMAFDEDVEYPLLCSLEFQKDGKVTKAEAFYRQTIKPENQVLSVKSAEDALNVTLNECGYVSIRRMLQLYDVEFPELLMELKGKVFLNPEKADENDIYAGWESSDEYLSGNVREKLEIAKRAAKFNAAYNENVQALTNVIPKDLTASEIAVSLGMTWIDVEDYQNFVNEVFQLSWHDRDKCTLFFEKKSHSYFIQNKNSHTANINIESTYGTERVNALELVESLLNLKQITVRDRFSDGTYVVNQKETMLAREKAELISEKFQEWFWNDTQRYEKYVRRYNDTFNNIIPCTYDGSYMTFPGMNYQISLKAHQKNAVARIIRNGNTLLAHCVGAGKSYEMAAACMEMKRLGIANKPMIVVPNHLTGQMANEFMSLYPNANILLTTKKDFEKTRRKRFVSRIATGDYDAVIMGHSMFEKIPVSKERQVSYIREEIDNTMSAIEEMKRENGENWTIKNMESQRKRLEEKMEKLVNEEYKDDVITFEELGVDALFVDEAHAFKNLDFTTKMSRVAGINPAGSNKATDMLLKIRYIQEMTPGRNVVFATGTPISNTMGEMYTMQKYMQPDVLQKLDMSHFDAWAANYGETVTSMELAPEGNAYREKTRFAKFKNLPELVSLYHMFADVQTADMLDLAVPKLKNDGFTIVESEPDEVIKEYMLKLAERADAVHNHSVSPDEDNMLKICHDAKLLSTDVRLINPTAVPDKESKLNKCVKNVFDKYAESADIKGTQIIFCDIGVPGKKDSFCVYDYIKSELVRLGVPEEEICFIHDANTDKKKDEMFADMRSGKKRIIIGSTEKMGAGTNIQKRCVAMHEIDCPWRPSDVEQREGRILRQGNENDEVEIFRYVTKGTFDAYNWNILVNKQRFISQVATAKNVTRECEDIGGEELSYAEVMAIASGNPYIREMNEVESQLRKLKTYKKSYDDTHMALRLAVEKNLPKKIDKYSKMRQAVCDDIERRDSYLSLHTLPSGKKIFEMTIGGKVFNDKTEANEYILMCMDKVIPGKESVYGEYMGFKFTFEQPISFIDSDKYIRLIGAHEYTRPAGADNVQILQNLMGTFEKQLSSLDEQIVETEKNLENSISELNKPFAHQDSLNTLMQRYEELKTLLTPAETDREEAKETDNCRTAASR